MPEKEKNVYFSLLQEPQDTIPQDTTQLDTIRKDSSIIDAGDSIKDTSEQVTTSEPEYKKLDSLTKAEERQEEKLQQQPQRKQAFQAQKPEPIKLTKDDSISALYDITGAMELPVLKRVKKDSGHINFLYNIPATKQDVGKTKVYKTRQSETKAYTEHPPKPKPLKPESTEQLTFDWISYLILAIFIFLGWTRIFFKRYFNTLFKSFHFINYAEELFQEKSSLTIRGATFLNGVYFIVLGLFSLQSIKFFYPSVSLAEYKIVLLSSGFFVLWYVWNALFKQFIGSVFQKIKVFTEYFYNYNIYRKIAGIILFPVIVINQYVIEEFTIYFIYSGIIIFIIIYLMHILRGLQTFIKNKVSIFYLILYLCALEFLPLLVFYEWITKEL